MSTHSRLRWPQLLFVCCLLLVANSVAFGEGQPLKSISYRLSMSRPVSHLFEVKVEVELPDPLTESLDFQMAKWSPGRYAVFDFAKNVQEFRALGGICPAGAMCKQPSFPVERIDDQTWRVKTMNTHTLTITYKVFANDLSGTFSQLNTTHANFNGGCIFMYIVGHKPDPVKLVINPPKDWRIVNGRIDQADQREWQFPNWDIMIDTPTEIAPDWTEDGFEVDGKKYHVVVHSLGNEGGKRAALVKDIERIVRAETAMWGAPEFDSYTFLIHFAADDHSGDGMEHLTSTQIIEPGALADSGVYEDTLGTVAHEFFHVWNVKRLRPVGLGPWDFTRPANTRGLWVAEGFTNYYGHLMERRAGIWDDARFLRRESATIEQIENAPGSHLMSAEESSISAPFLDRASHAQKTNLPNTSISYYPKGELIAMALDLLIRGKTGGKASLDEVMRRMYVEFYLKSPNDSYYLRGRGYTIDDVRRVASEVAGTDLSEFFTRHIYSVEMLPYEEAFGYAGLHLVRQPASEPFTAGISLDRDKESPTIWSVRNYSAAEGAGLERGDQILTLGGKKVTLDNWMKLFAKHKEGEKVAIKVKRDRRTLMTTISIGPPDRFEYHIEELPGATVEQKALRAAWMKG
jgi:predicted metalloprotease with PDZ domain